MENLKSSVAQKIAQAARAFQRRRTGHEPRSVAVALSGDTLQITLDGAFPPAEEALAQSPEGAVQIREFYRQVFSNSAGELRQEIKRITGVAVREATAEVEPATGTVVQVFTTGSMVRLSAETKAKICQQHRRGESVQALARRFCRTPSRIYRIINETRAAQVMELPLDHIGNEEFARLRSEKEEAAILGPLPESDLPTRKPRVPSGLPSYLASLYEMPLLTREQEAHLFRKMNYLKYKATALRAQLDVNRPKSRLIGRIEKLYDESVTTKNQIIRANLRLVVSIAKRYVGAAGDFFELVSDGNMSLIRAVGKFDFARGYKLSTYASWAIMKNFARTIPDVIRQRSRFSTSHSEMLGAVEDARADQYEQELAQIQRESHVGAILKRLEERERRIVTSRFGLTRGQEPQTLKQVGATMGVTKERVRQIQSRAMGKLRKAAEEGRVEYSL
jgi:RNA polymerase primary sigma factor/RNA polymerase sigma factor